MYVNSNKIDEWAFSIDDVSKRTSLSKSFLRNEIRNGQLKVTRYGRRILVLRQDLENYLTNRGGFDEKENKRNK